MNGHEGQPCEVCGAPCPRGSQRYRRKTCSDECWSAANRAGTTRTWKDPVIRAKRLVAHAATIATPEYRANMRAALADPDVKARMRAGQRAAATPERRAAISKRLAGNRLAKDAPVKGECVYCGKPAKTMDHSIPRGRPGSDEPDNLVPCCWACNASKHDRTPEEWLADGLYGQKGQAAQALVEFALVMPLLLFVLIGFADVALLSWYSIGWQIAADSIAAVPDSAVAEMARVGCEDGTVTFTEADGLRIAALECPYAGPTSILDGNKVTTASAPLTP